MKNIGIILIIAIISPAICFGQKYIEQNQPTVDFKRLHFGFSVGFHSQDLIFSHVDQSLNAEQWYGNVTGYAPGFSVGLLSDYLLSRYFNLRFAPGLHFGSKEVKYREWNSGAVVTQDLKSNYLYFPLELKYSSLRLNNTRPYLIVGGAIGYDLARKKGDSEYIRLQPVDTYLEIGVGCDLYFDYFKLNPELKFCFGLNNVLDKSRSDLEEQTTGTNLKKYTNALSAATSRLVVLTFYFE